MLRLSKLTDYGTVILSHMGRQPELVFSVAEMAAALGVAPPTVAKVLKTLAKRDLVRSRRGSKGGYFLARPPEAISVADVIDALESPFGLTECGIADGRCTRESECHIRAPWLKINRIVRRSLEQVTLADMRDDDPPAAGRETRDTHGKPVSQPR